HARWAGALKDQGGHALVKRKVKDARRVRHAQQRIVLASHQAGALVGSSFVRSGTGALCLIAERIGNGASMKRLPGHAAVTRAPVPQDGCLAGMQLSQFKALSFDCYGTLIDWEAGILKALEPLRKQAGISPDELLD